MKVAFLDRDGTINKDYEDEKWSCISEPELFESTIEAMKYLCEIGYKIIILTNQYIIGENIITLKQYNDFNKKLLNILKSNDIEVLDVFFCPHKKSNDCDCCKPKVGMIKQAMSKYPDIELEKSFVCGDSQADKKLAENMNMKFFGIKIQCENSINSLADLKKELS